MMFENVAIMRPDTTMGEIMQAAWPIVFIAIGCMVFMCFFPGIVTWLPAVLRATP